MQIDHFDKCQGIMTGIYKLSPPHTHTPSPLGYKLFAEKCQREYCIQSTICILRKLMISLSEEELRLQCPWGHFDIGLYIKYNLGSRNYKVNSRFSETNNKYCQTRDFDFRPGTDNPGRCGYRLTPLRGLRTHCATNL